MAYATSYIVSHFYLITFKPSIRIPILCVRAALLFIRIDVRLVNVLSLWLRLSPSYLHLSFPLFFDPVWNSLPGLLGQSRLTNYLASLASYKSKKRPTDRLRGGNKEGDANNRRKNKNIEAPVAGKLSCFSFERK